MPSRALDLASKSKAWRLQLRISSGKVDLQALSTDAERAQMQKEPEPESARGPHGFQQVPVPVDLQEALRRLDGKERHGTQKELESYM